MQKLGRYAVSSALLAALMALPCVASAYEAPEAYCHDLAEAAYQLADAQGAAFPDESYERVQATCEFGAYRAHLLADSSASLNELVAFDQDGESFDVEAGWN